MGCTISTATRDCDPQEDPSDDRSFPFFLSASILRHQQAEPFSIPERTCYPSHGMGPMSVMGGRGGMGVQWQPSLQSVSRFSEISRHLQAHGLRWRRCGRGRGCGRAREGAIRNLSRANLPSPSPSRKQHSVYVLVTADDPGQRFPQVPRHSQHNFQANFYK